MIVLEEKSVGVYLAKRKFLLNAYYKTRNFLESEKFESIKLKKREPKSEGIYQFRITKKYRAFGYFRDKYFIVTEINDHQ